MPVWQILLTVVGGVVAVTGLIRVMLQDLKKELRGEIADLRTEVRGDISELRGELKDVRREVSDLRTAVHGLDVTVVRLQERFVTRSPSGSPAE